MARPYAADDWSVRKTMVKNSGLKSAANFVYRGRGGSDRQRCFYRILLRMHKKLGDTTLPVVIPRYGNQWRMDFGCVKMAVDDGVIKPLKDCPASGVVKTVELNLSCLKKMATG